MIALVDADHADAVFNGTDEPAEVAAYTFMLVYFGDATGGSGVRDGGTRGSGNERVATNFSRRLGVDIAIDMDALVCAVPTGGITELATDTGFRIDAGDDFVIEIEMLPLSDARE